MVGFRLLWTFLHNPSSDRWGYLTCQSGKKENESKHESETFGNIFPTLFIIQVQAGEPSKWLSDWMMIFILDFDTNFYWINNVVQTREITLKLVTNERGKKINEFKIISIKIPLFWNLNRKIIDDAKLRRETSDKWQVLISTLPLTASFFFYY